MTDENNDIPQPSENEGVAEPPKELEDSVSGEVVDEEMSEEDEAAAQLYINHLRPAIYKTPPVDIITFLKDDYFLGGITKNLKTVYPGWIEPMQEIFEDDSKYLIVLTGGIGIGKTEVICGFCIPYILYKINCMVDPWQYYSITEHGKMEVTFFNLTRSFDKSKGFSFFQNSLLKSPYFLDKGIVRGDVNPHLDLPGFEWSLASPYSKGFGILGGAIITGVMDEVDSPNESEGQKKRILQAYSAAERRFESRFVKNGTSIGRLFLAASKQEELSFLEIYIAEMRNSGKMWVYDKKKWEIVSERFSDERFYVSVGDQFHPPKVLASKEEAEQHMKDGFQVEEVPEDLRFDYERDLVGALRDHSGISVKGIRIYKFIPAESFIRECMDPEKVDPVGRETIEIGQRDEMDLIHYIDMSKIRNDLRVPRCVHIDIAYTEDSLGLACSGIADWVDLNAQKEDGTIITQKMPLVETDFIFRLKAKPSDRIPLFAVRKLILDLKMKGLNIRMVTLDLPIASEDTRQLLEKAGMPTDYLSVDRDVKPYMEWRTLLYEHRWVCHPHNYLYFELKNLEYDRIKNKVTHPDKVKELEFLPDHTTRDVVIAGSKDVADAVVGSVYKVIETGMHPPDIKAHIDALHKLKQSKLPGGLPEDWFIRDASKKQAGPLLGTGHLSSDNAEKMKEALRKLRLGGQGRPGAHPGQRIF